MSDTDPVVEPVDDGVTEEPECGMECRFEKHTAAVNLLLLVVSTGFILLMQAGFALVENGTVREKNSANILIKNLFDACAGCIAFYLVGFGFAFGVQCVDLCDTEEPVMASFIGTDIKYFAASGFNAMADDQFIFWCFQFSFAATASTIVSGSLAERTRLPAYFAFSVLMTGFIYPVVVAWTWGGGWLT